MKLKLLAVASAMFVASSAMAADIYQPPAAYDWSGGYFGIQGGGMWGDVNQNIGPSSGDMSGGLVGGYLGWRQQWSALVVGAELGGNWRWADGSNDDGAGGTLNVHQDWDASLVAKVGIPLDNFLVYALGGGDVTNFNVDDVGSVSNTVFGWTVGAGVEAALSQNLTARVEYRFTDYGDMDASAACGAACSISPNEHTVALGVTYRF